MTNVKVEEMPLVSVGVPTYNRAEKLSETLCSLSVQSYKNIEIIVSDNCSSDTNVIEVVRKFSTSDSRIRFHRQQTNIGPGKNFEFVKEKAKGNFFLWLADDDTLSPDYIEKCVKYLVDNPDYVLVAGFAKFYRPDETYYDGEVICLPDSSPEERVNKYLKMVDGNSVFYGVYRTKIVKQVSFSNILAGDWLFIGEIALIGKIHTLKDVFIHREASHLFLSDPWGRLCSYYKLPIWAKRIPEVWIGLEIKKGIQHSEIFRKYLNNKKFSWKIFRLLLFNKYRKKMSFRKIPYILMAIIYHHIVCKRRTTT